MTLPWSQTFALESQVSALILPPSFRSSFLSSLYFLVVLLLSRRIEGYRHRDSCVLEPLHFSSSFRTFQGYPFGNSFSSFFLFNGPILSYYAPSGTLPPSWKCSEPSSACAWLSLSCVELEDCNCSRIDSLTLCALIPFLSLLFRVNFINCALCLGSKRV